jgi:hypothetical protein
LRFVQLINIVLHLKIKLIKAKIGISNEVLNSKKSRNYKFINRLLYCKFINHNTI